MSPRIYKVALALGDYLKVRAHACIGGKDSFQDKNSGAFGTLERN